MNARTIPALVSSTFALALFLSGCGAEPAPQGTATPASAPAAVSDIAPAGTPAAVPDEDGPPGGGPTDPHGLGKHCWVDCAVTNNGAMSCPARVTGYGETTFLGGCQKACRKAEGDAASKLGAGCSLDNCSRRGC